MSQSSDTLHPQYVCIHGHFYQPPRENPWLEAIELQDSAAPFHDWNARITAECYAPNSAARIQDNDGHILGIINNYARMSFNFGPTLLSWMEAYVPDVYQSILEADRESVKKFSGHGSAIAQVYNHIIMPLANRRDKETQILWGIADFERRFRRPSEGMWLAECAVDTETLELLAENGIKYTVLAPGQARQIRPLAANAREHPDVGWEDVDGARIDPARAYQCELPSGRSIALFFYDGPISQAVAFEGLLRSGEDFARRLMTGFSNARDYPQLMHIATDGETYGHHHKFGDMGLAYAMHALEKEFGVRLTVYGEYLEKYPPTWEVRIHESSSWSCVHGVERWRSNCGCNTGGLPGWNQEWRGPLRDALDWLRNTVDPLFESEAKRIFSDPWKARNGYIRFVLERNSKNENEFFERYSDAGSLGKTDRCRGLKLMELQRQLMLMYTSCGWFFTELSGIETVQVIQYAGRAIQLAEELFEKKFEPEFRTRLEKARSNIAAFGNGQVIYDRFVKPAFVDLIRVAAHYAVSNLFHPVGDKARIYAFDVERTNLQLFEAGQSRLAIGQSEIRSIVTGDTESVTHAVLHFGDHNLTAGVRGPVSSQEFKRFVDDASAAFLQADLPALIRIFDREFYGLTYSLASLFRDEQRRIVNEILKNTLEQMRTTLRMAFEGHAPLMNFLAQIGVPQPEVLRAAGRFVLGADLRDTVEQDIPDPASARALLENARRWNIPVDAEGVEVAINSAILHRAEQIAINPDDTAAMESLLTLADVAHSMPFAVNFWRAQNVYFSLLKNRLAEKRAEANRGNDGAKEWIDKFLRLGQALKIRIEQ